MTPEQRADIEREIADLDNLLTSPGWKRFEAKMKADADEQLKAAKTQPSSETAKHLAAYISIIESLSWPHTQRLLLVDVLKRGTQSRTGSR